MMRLVLPLLFVSIPFLGLGQTCDDLWKEVTTLERGGQPRSALEKVEQLHRKAIAEKNGPQLIKAVIHGVKFNAQFEEESLVLSIGRLEDDVKTLPAPTRQVVHSLLGEMYMAYWHNNSWQIRQRTAMEGEGGNLLTWDFKRIVEAADRHYTLSLQGADTLRNARLESYATILEGESHYRDLRPTLYHLLLSRAMDFYASEDRDLVNFDTDGIYDNPALLADVATFLKVSTADGLRPADRTIGLFQELLREAGKVSPKARLIEDLRRLEYMHRRSQAEHKDSLFEKELERLLPTEPDPVMKAEVIWHIAELWFNQGNGNTADTTILLKWKQAHDRCAEAVKGITGNALKEVGPNNCLQLMQRIEQREWNTTAQGAVLPAKPFRFLLNYRNVGESGSITWPAHVRVASIDPIKFREESRRNYGEKLTEWLLKNSTTISTKTFDLPNPQDFRSHSIELPMDGLPIGTYVIFAATDKDFKTKGEAVAHAIITVTDLTLLKRATADGHTLLRVVSREKGMPVKGARIELLESFYDRNSRSNNHRLKETLTTDAKGEAVYRHKGQGYGWLIADVFSGDDRLIGADNVLSYHGVEDVRGSVSTMFFLDRAIYRPGQIIHFKGIMLRSNGIVTEPRLSGKGPIMLYDANGQEVASVDVAANKFGTFSGTFIAPTGGLNGVMRISDGIGSHSFRVEEYKRPRFEVKLDAPKEQLRVGDTVTVQGAAISYAGVPLADAEVRYRITRHARFPYPWRCWGWFPQSNPKQVAYGTATTDADGRFTVQFPAQPDPLMRSRWFPVFSYSIEADVTDRSGEMQTGSSSVSVGYHALDLGIAVPDVLEKGALKSYPVSATNLMGEAQDVAVKVTVWQLKPNDRILRKRPWAKADQHLLTESEYRKLFPNDPFGDENDPNTWQKAAKTFETTVRTGSDGQLDLSKVPFGILGHYLIELSATDAFGREVMQQARFLLIDRKGERPAIPVTAWFRALQEKLEPNDTLDLLVASSYPDVQFTLDIEVKDKGVRTNRFIHSEQFALSNGQRLLRIPVTEEWRGNATVHLLAVRNNELLSWAQTVTVPFTNKELDVQLETFRKEMTPDDAEEWTLRITDRKGNPVKAELLATMYDASLDVLAPNHWRLNPYRSLNPRLNWASAGFGNAQGYVWDREWRVWPKGTIGRDFEELNWFEYSLTGIWNNPNYGIKRKNRLITTQALTAFEGDSDDGIAESAEMQRSAKAAPAAMSGAAMKDEEAGQEIAASEPAPEVKLRSDFSETVFFHPHLTTDGKGGAVIRFSAPQSLTRWKFMGLATTEDLSIGTITEEVVTRKLLMVTPNYPRFVREGDKLRFQVKVDVVDSTMAEVNASLEVRDGLTGEALKLEIGNRKLTIENGGAVAAWEIDVPEGVSALTFTVKAWGKGSGRGVPRNAPTVTHTDGEEKTIPVLPNRMLVIEAMPLPVRGKGTFEFTFSKLLASGGRGVPRNALTDTTITLRHHSLTLEFTPNPIWLAVLSLPYMMEYPHDCAEQIFSRFYANAIGTHLANSDPAIKRVFEAWKRVAESREGDAFQSQLEKNPELKQALLNETPWVRDAQNETEQRRRIAELFDTQRMQTELDNALRKLQQQQRGDGGWGWFSGLRSDLYMTRHIVAGFGKLRKMGVWEPDATSQTMLRRAVEFMDEELVKYYDRTDLKNKDRVPDWFELHTSYSRSFWLEDFKAGGRSKAICADILSRIKTHWTKFDATQKGMAVVILHRNGMTKDAAQMMVSLRETSTVSEEFGTYWAMEKGYYWHQAPIENHVMILEAFHEVANDTAMVDEMKIWLLKQKQTQAWKTTKATADACYALLGWGLTRQTLTTTPDVSITIGSETIDPRTDRDLKTEAGTGYFKTNWTGKSITPDMGKVTVTKDSDGVAWGAVYWQYFENLDKITGAEDNPIKMKREVMLLRDTDSGPVMTPLGRGLPRQALTVGDRVRVRIVLETDRHMEYVHLKDMRAASFEPRQQLSGAEYREGLGFYRSTTDAAMNFFFSYLPKGTFVFEYDLNVTQAGEFSNGISQVQCMYAPEFTTHSEGVRVGVE